MKVTDIPYVARHLLDKYGLTKQGWTFAWDHARRRAGCCRYSRKRITLSKYYVELNVAERLGDIIDTILHEIAHALVGPKHGHDDVWKAKCVEIGARPERCYDSKVIDMPKGKYVAACKCGKVYRRHKALRQGRWAYCLNCGPEKGRLDFRCGPPPTTTNVAPTPMMPSVPSPMQPRKLR